MQSPSPLVAALLASGVMLLASVAVAASPRVAVILVIDRNDELVRALQDAIRSQLVVEGLDATFELLPGQMESDEADGARANAVGVITVSLSRTGTLSVRTVDRRTGTAYHRTLEGQRGTVARHAEVASVVVASAARRFLEDASASRIQPAVEPRLPEVRLDDEKAQPPPARPSTSVSPNAATTTDSPAIDVANRVKCDDETGKNTSAKRLLTIPPCSRIKQDALRILDTSREVLRRVQRLAFLYQLTGTRAYARRAIDEIVAVSEPSWGDWNRPHFLDTAEMSHAVALGYDWLYAEMTPDERTLVRSAIVEKGLRPGLAEYQDNAAKTGHWSHTTSNWNLVSNGGLATAALAIGDEEPALAAQILVRAVGSVRASGAAAAFGPDGAYSEGIGYWAYATTYLTAMLASLETALGTDFGLGAIEGLSEAATFPMYAIGPGGRPFNYADVGDGLVTPSSTMHYFAARYGRPEYGGYARETIGPFGALWRNPSFATFDLSDVPLSRRFRKAEVAVIRSGTRDSDAYLGFKSGSNAAGHSHLDLGSFIYDANGVRWAMDLGLEPYGPVGNDYFDPVKRWTFYRTRAEGQNTLVINPSFSPDQDTKAGATIEKLALTPTSGLATTTLTQAYSGAGAKKVARGVYLDKASQSLRVQDEIELAASGEAYWFMHTRAQVTLAGNKATLRIGDKSLGAEILSPPGAAFTVMEASPLPSSPPNPKGSASNAGVRKLTVHLQNVSATTLVVELTPSGSAAVDASPIKPLSAW